ncbi:MAG: glycine zipper 2TM domain-containing protein [Pseudomonadota bacterium]
MKKKLLLLIALFTCASIPYTYAHSEIVGYKIVKKPQRKCWTQTIQPQTRDYTGAVIGGVAGGLLGSQIGGGNARFATTAIGAGTGAMVGNSISRKRNTRTVHKCKMVTTRVRVPIYGNTH